MIKLLLTAVAALNTLAVAAGIGAEWKLIWADEFDVAGKPDPGKWTYEYTGFLRNKEEQWYTDSEDNIFVKDGFLHIVARRVDLPNPWYKADSNNWKFNRERIRITSSGIKSNDRFTCLYGRIEMRAKLPAGQGVWPAFWTIGTGIKGWPTCGEIDIFEYLGREPGRSALQGAIHWKNNNGKHQQANQKIYDIDLSDSFHVFAIEWDQEKITFFLDDNAYFTVSLDKANVGEYNAFRHPHFLLVNLAIGGTLGGKVDETIFPAKYIVDYIRVYQRTPKSNK